jgi:hypothetical protein
MDKYKHTHLTKLLTIFEQNAGRGVERERCDVMVMQRW